MTPLVQLLTALAAAAVLMLILWNHQRRTRNAGIVDVGWTFGVGGAVLFFAAYGDGDGLRRGLIAAMTGLWSLRLGTYLAHRVSTEPEDGRYQNLRAWAGENAQPVLLGFFMLQATWVILFSLPQFAAIQNTQSFAAADVAALLLFATSLIGAAIADRQLAAWRTNPANRGRTCRGGLWRYSRHPNYFFEWLHWFAYPLMATGLGGWAWLTWLAPLVMLVFLLFVTGVPPTEARALQSRGEDYRRYQRETSVFIPWLPRRVPEETSS